MGLINKWIILRPLANFKRLSLLVPMAENAEQITRLMTGRQGLCVQEIPPDRRCLQKAGKYGPLPSKTDEKQDLVKRVCLCPSKTFPK